MFTLYLDNDDLQIMPHLITQR